MNRKLDELIQVLQLTHNVVLREVTDRMISHDAKSSKKIEEQKIEEHAIKFNVTNSSPMKKQHRKNLSM